MVFRFFLLSALLGPLAAWTEARRHFQARFVRSTLQMISFDYFRTFREGVGLNFFRNAPDEPHERPGLLIAARDLAFGVINFRLYYALLIIIVLIMTLEQYKGFEPSPTEWKSIMLPLHQYCRSPTERQLVPFFYIFHFLIAYIKENSGMALLSALSLASYLYTLPSHGTGREGKS